VAGPVFISVGQPDQLAKFIELNPELKGTALVDDSATFEGYKAAGFNYLMGDKVLDSPPAMKPPDTMTTGKWFTYLRNVIGLSPVPKDLKFGEVPPGVKVIGGTYAVDGDEVLFSHMDEVPGATPDIEAVLDSLGA